MTPRILQLVYQFSIGGRTETILLLSDNLNAAGLAISLAAFSLPDVEEFKSRSTDRYTILTTPQKNSKLNRLSKVISTVKRERIQLIHTHCESSYVFGGIVGRILKIPVIGTFHRSDKSFYLNSWRARLRNRGLLHKIAVSHNNKQLMMQGLQIPENEISVIHNGIDLSRFFAVTPSQQNEIRQQFSIPLDENVLLSVGHLGKIKGHDTTLQALPTILQQHPNTRLYLAGIGSEMDQKRLEGLTVNLDVVAAVKFLGQISQPELWMRACDIFLQPPIDEGFGLVFAEAGATAKPVVASRVGGIPEIIKQGETGILVPPQDPMALADQVNRLLSQPDYREQLGQAARKYIAANFDIKQTAAKYQRIYQRYLQG